MASGPDDKRSLTISAASPEALAELINQIPGYRREEIEPETLRRMMLPEGEERFALITPSGDKIYTSIPAGSAEAHTVNIILQDDISHPIPLHSDEIVGLHKAIQAVSGLQSHLHVAIIDLELPTSPAD